MKSKIIRVQNAIDACILLDQHQGAAKLLAGGTDVLVQIRDGSISPAFLLDVSEVDELRILEFGATELNIGAGITLSELVDSQEIYDEFPSLWAAAKDVGAEQIRNRATIGGNLANGSPAADMVPPLVSLDAELSIQGLSGVKRIAAFDLAKGPGNTALELNEIILAVHIPRRALCQGDAFLKVGKRKALAISVANVAVSVCLSEDEKCFESARIALGSVAPTVVRAFSCEESLRGKEIDSKVIDLALEKLEREISPIDDLRASANYRRMVSKRITKQAILQAAESKKSNWKC